MAPLYEETLLNLFRRGEAAELRKSTRVVRERFTGKSNPYWKLSFDDRNLLHHYMQQAANAGAVELHWSRYGGSDRTLDYVDLVSVQALARHLGYPTRHDRLAEAKALLAKWITQPRVAEIVSAWANLRRVRTMDPECAQDFADALRVIDFLKRNDGDQVVRQLSVTLFSNSKRIEDRLTRHLDILTADSLTTRARHWQEVFSSLGMHKEPQPFLISGSGTIRLHDNTQCPLVRPFVGLSNRAITGFIGHPAWLLTIENLTTFHMAAQQLEQRTDGLILFTGGMPSPAWRAAYRTILEDVPPATRLYHWGDFDEGGFRIASIVSACANDIGHLVLPWLMSPEEVGVTSPVPCSKAVAKAMAQAAMDAGWVELAQEVESQCSPKTAEQEGQQVLLPT